MATESTATTAAPTTTEAAPAAAPAQAAQAQQGSVQRDLSLHEAMAAHLRSVRQQVGKPAEEPSKTEATTEAGQTESAKDGKPAEQATEVTQQAAGVAQTTEQGKDPSATAEPADERAKALAEYVRGKKANREQAAKLKAEADRQKAEDARLATERTKIAEDRARVEKLTALQSKIDRDPVGAIEEFLGGKDKISGDLLLQILERSQGGEAKPASDEERQAAIVEAVREQLKADLRKEDEEKAKTKAAEEKAADEQAWAVRFGQLSQHLTANAEKYPLMAADGYDTAEMQKAINTHRQATGQWPTMDQVLFHFEDILTKQTERRQSILAARKQKEQTTTEAAPANPAAKSPAAAPVKVPVDARGKPGKVIQNRDVFKERDAIAARLDGRATG